MIANALSRPENGVWSPEKRLTVEQAIQVYTINGAHLMHLDDVAGSIEEGEFSNPFGSGLRSGSATAACTKSLISWKVGDPGRIAVAAPRLGVPGRFATREQTATPSSGGCALLNDFKHLQTTHTARNREGPRGTARSRKTPASAPKAVRRQLP
jgi:hypothetical protein